MRKALLLFLTLALAAQAFAAVYDIPSTVRFQGRPETISFTVTNHSREALPFDVRFDLVETQFIERPAEIPAGQSAEIKVLLLPAPELEGSAFQSNVTLRLGNQKTTQAITYEFMRSEERTPVAMASLAPGPVVDLSLAALALVLLIALIVRLSKKEQ